MTTQCDKEMEPVVNLLSSLVEHIKNNTLNKFLNNFKELTPQYFSNCPWPTLQELSITKIIPENTLQGAIYNHYRIYDWYYRRPNNQTSNQMAIDFMGNLKKIFRLLVRKYPIERNFTRTSNDSRIINSTPFTELYLFELLSSIALGFEVNGDQSSTGENIWDYDSCIRLCNFCDATVSINNYLKDLENTKSKLFAIPVVPVYMSYISLIVTARLNCAARKYEEALASLANMNVFRDCILTSSFSLLSFHFYKGFALLMTRRIVEARDCLMTGLETIKFSNESSTGYRNDIIEMRDKMSNLVAICYYLWPASLRMNSHVLMSVREIYYHLINGGNLLENVFKSGCPFYISPEQPGDGSLNSHIANFLVINQEFYRYSILISMAKVYTSAPLNIFSSRLSINESEANDVQKNYMEVVRLNKVEESNEIITEIDDEFINFYKKEKQFDMNTAYKDMFIRIEKVKGKINLSKV